MYQPSASNMFVSIWQLYINFPFSGVRQLLIVENSVTHLFPMHPVFTPKSIRKALFILEILTFLSLLFIYIEKRLDNNSWIFSKFLTSQTRQRIISIHILLNISRSKGNQTLKFGQLIKLSVRNITSSRPHLKASGHYISFNIFPQISTFFIKASENSFYTTFCV